MRGYESTFDIFRGSSDDPVWIEKVAGLVSACERIEKLASEQPGTYFATNSENQSVVVEVDNRFVHETSPTLHVGSTDRKKLLVNRTSGRRHPRHAGRERQ
jgi:hypothetical protein